MKYAILGFGESGRAVASYLTEKREPYRVYEVGKKIPYFQKIYPHLEFLPFGNPIEEEILFRSPGVRPDHPSILRAVASGSRLTGEAEMFVHLTPAKVFAITGSDGKTTTASMSAHLFRAMGKTVWLGGNIGMPLLPLVEEMTSEDTVVLELSSFQLMTFQEPVTAALITNLTENHLDWHKGFGEYKRAKENLLLHAGRRVVSLGCYVGEGLPSITYSAACQAANYHIRPDGIYRGDRWLCPRDIAHPPGLHNLENVLGAMALTQIDGAAAYEAMGTFQGVPHRMEFVGEYGGVICYDSSIDTTPSRSRATLCAMPGPSTVICGGHSKGGSNLPLCEALMAHTEYAVFTGECGQEMLEDLKKHPLYKGTPKTEYVKDFRGAVIAAYEHTPKGGYLLLTPGATSHDAFSSYGERGACFQKILKDL